MSTIETPPGRPVLGYTQRPRRWRRRLWLLATVIAVGVVIWQWQTVRTLAQVRYAVWQTYRAQSACEASGVPVGSVVLRTDGRTDGVLRPVALPPPPGRPLEPLAPVINRSDTCHGFLQQCDALVQTTRGRGRGGKAIGMSSATSWAIPTVGSRFRWLAGASPLIDCRRQKDSGGNTVLAWVGIDLSLIGQIGIRTATMTPGTAFRPPQVNLPQSNALPVDLYLSHNPLGGPLVIRRVAAVRAEDVRLALEYGGGTSYVTATWSGNHYAVQAEPGPQITVDAPSGRINLHAVRRRLPIIEKADHSIKLPEDFMMPRAIAAVEGGLIVYSDWRGGNSEGQVHRLNWADGRVQELIAPSKALGYYGTLSGDGSRITSRGSGPPDGPPTITSFDLKHGRSPRGDPTIAAGAKIRDVKIADDGRTLLVRLLREPIWQFDGELRVVRRIPSQRADWLMPNGQYVARIAPGTLDFYDLKAGVWSPPLEQPHGANQAYPSPDGRLVCCGDRLWCVLDTASGQVVTSLLGVDNGSSASEAAVFSPDGRWLAIMGVDVYLIDLRDPNRPDQFEIATPRFHGESIATFTPASDELVLQQETMVRRYRLNGIAARASAPSSAPADR